MGNLGLICGNPCGGKSRGLGLMGGPQSLIPFGPIIGGIKGGTIPRPLGPNIKGGTPGPGLIGPIPGGGRGNIILCRIGPNIAGGPPIGGGGIRGGIPGIGGRTPWKRGSGGRIPAGSIRGPGNGPLFKGLIFCLQHTTEPFNRLYHVFNKLFFNKNILQM